LFAKSRKRLVLYSRMLPAQQPVRFHLSFALKQINRFLL